MGGQWKVTPHTKEKLLGFFSVGQAEAIFLADSQKCVTVRSLLSLKEQRASVRSGSDSQAKSPGGGGTPASPLKTEQNEWGQGALQQAPLLKGKRAQQGPAGCGVNTQSAPAAAGLTNLRWPGHSPFAAFQQGLR